MYGRKKGDNKKVRNATPIEKDGIKYRSKLELYTVNRFDEAGIESDYECHRFSLLDKFTFDGEIYESHKIKGVKEFTKVSNNVRAITYTPDFVNMEKKFIVEVKGFANDVFPLKWKMFKNHLINQGFTLYLPSTQKQVRDTVELIKEKFYESKNTINITDS